MLPRSVYAASSENNPNFVKLKAALIFKIGNYINWKSKFSKKNYCFVGEKGNRISHILNEMLDNGKIPKSIEISHHDSINDIKLYQCQILYIDDIQQDEELHLKQLSEATLTIVDNVTQLSQGGIISIEIDRRGPKLYASLRHLKNSNIEIHSRLLSTMTLIK